MQDNSEIKLIVERDKKEEGRNRRKKIPSDFSGERGKAAP